MTRRLRKMGVIPSPTICRVCGQKNGIIQYHNTDYDVSLEVQPKMLNNTATEEDVKRLQEVLLPVCWRCHMMIHKKEHHPLSYEKYMQEINSGVRFDPVFVQNDWHKLDQHIID